MNFKPISNLFSDLVVEQYPYGLGDNEPWFPPSRAKPNAIFVSTRIFFPTWWASPKGQPFALYPIERGLINW